MRIKIDKNKLEKLYVKQQLDGRTIAKILGVSSWTVWNRLKLFELPIRKQIPHPKISFSGDLKERAYMLGFRTGDLYVMKKSPNCIKVEGGSSQPIFLKIFERIFGKYGIFKTYERKGNITKKWFKVISYLDSSFEFLVEKLNEIPESIMNDNEHFLSFLAGYSDAEGSWIIANHTQKVGKSKDSIFSLGSCDKVILYQIYQKLKELGFNSHIYLSKKAGTSTQLGEYHSDFYRIRLYGKDVAKLAELLLSLSQHEDKQKHMVEIIELEKMKIEKLGTIEIPCSYCSHKRVSKCGGYFYKGKRFQRYKCPICKEVFSEQTIKKLKSTSKISCLYCGEKVRKHGFYSYKGRKHQSYECPSCIKVFTELTLDKIQKRDKTLGNLVHRGFKYANNRSFT